MKILGSGAGAAWSRIFLPGAGATLQSLEPESAPGPRTSGAGAAQKSGGSVTLLRCTGKKGLIFSPPFKMPKDKFE